MITPSDFVTVKNELQWFEAGLKYALISWTSTFNRMGKPNPYNRLQKIILGLIAEKAFEDYLKKNKIAYETKGKTKWYEVDRYDIGINGYAVDVKANFLDLKSNYIQSKINNLFEEKNSWFTRCHALVPLDQFNPGINERRAHIRNKIYIFPFIEGFFNDTKKSKYFVHTFWSYQWLKKGKYFSTLPNLGNLFIKYKGSSKNVEITIYGTSAKNKACIEKIKLKQYSEVTTKNNFYQIFSILSYNKDINGDLIITSKDINLTETIKPEYTFELVKIPTPFRPVYENEKFLKDYFNRNFHLNKFNKINNFNNTKLDLTNAPGYDSSKPINFKKLDRFVDSDGTVYFYGIEQTNLKDKLCPSVTNMYWPIKNNWQCLDIHDCKINFLGWIYEEDFRLIGKTYKRFTHSIEQYQETKVDNWGCLINELEPIIRIKDIEDGRE